MLTVVSLWRHPVKSMQGHAVDRVDVDERGVVDDRRWGVRDVATGNVLTGRRAPDLLHAIGGLGTVTLPTGETTSDDTVLSRWLGRPVELIGTADGVRSTYEVPLDPLDGEQQWASWEGPAASFVDSTKSAVTLVSTATLGDGDPRRFRMNVVLAGATTPDEEAALVGRRIKVGSVVLDVTKRVDRCVMVTRSQPGLDRDLEVLRRINVRHGGCLGVGALVVEPGSIAVGDALLAM